MSYQFSQDPEEDLPNWLKALRRRQSDTPEPEAEAQAQEQPPSASVPETQPTDPQPAQDPAPTAKEEPDWLLDIRRRVQGDQPAREPLPEETAQAQPEPEEEPLPDLSDLLSEIEQESKVPLSDTQPQPAASPDLPDPTGGLESISPDSSSVSEELSEENAQDSSVDEQASSTELGAGIPDWFFDDDDEEEEQVQPPQQPPSPSAFLPSEEEALAPADLPPWLRAIRPTGALPPLPSLPSDEPTDQEETGPLAGLSGILPAEPEIIQVGRTGSLSFGVEANPNQQRHVNALKRMLASEHASKEDFQRRIARPTRFLRWIIAGILLISVLIPLLTGSRNSIRPSIGAYPETSALFNQIETLPPDAPVLIAFEVQPALIGELQTVAVPVLDHLLERQARLVFVSTSPTGPALVERLLGDQLSQQPSIASGDYVNLGYLSGAAAGLRQFATDPLSFHATQWAHPALAPIQSLSDFSLVLVISSDGEEARAWIEQVGRALPQGLSVATSAQAGPLLFPYLQSHPATLKSLIAGLSGAANYEALRGREGLARAYWDAYSFGVGAMVILILLGGLYGRLIHIRPERRIPVLDDETEEPEPPATQEQPEEDIDAFG
ncbi:MAG: hypothetical protein DWG76_07490 [Chloroflexi bacterium]|nr:hypothetical protein [Chloroflexota bacterium]